MIPFLLHARSPGGTPPPSTTLIDPPTYSGYRNVAYRYSVSGPASATLRLIIRANGSWEIQRTPGTYLSGFWTTEPAAGVGTSFEARFTDVGGIGTPTTTTNHASDWTSLSADRVIEIVLTRSTFGADSVYRDYNIEIRQVGGTGVAGVARFECYVEIG